MNLFLESLGCARNLVDSEIMLGRFAAHGWQITKDPALAHAIIVNTCSFIEAAVNESIDTILALARFKKTGTCQRLIVVGCLPERFGVNIVDTLPEVDAFIGTGALDQVLDAADITGPRHVCTLADPNAAKLSLSQAPRILTCAHVAYLKIAEGCERHCTYCIIPKLRGRLRSRPVNDIIREARHLIASGVREIVLVAQETTAYGHDLDRSVGLGLLLEKIALISKDVWIRVLYGHPGSIDDAAIDAIARHSNICPYFDLPIQHADDRLLQKMGRHYTRDDLHRLFDTIRTRVPQAVLRTTVIVGFPGETEQAFKDLMQFVKDIRFDNLGVFTYSDSEDLVSHKLADHVSIKTAKHRCDTLMACQKDISLENNIRHIGKTYDVLVDEAPEAHLFIGRTCFQAPEVDGITYVNADGLNIGDVVHVKITDALEYDLSGEPV